MVRRAANRDRRGHGGAAPARQPGYCQKRSRDPLSRQPGCRLAEPGEFARRAFHNGKLDLAQVEGLADLIDAETEAQRRQALSQMRGALSELYEGWRNDLIRASALVEAAIDFSDEADVASDAFATARKMVSELHAAIAAHLADGNRGEILRDGFRVVLAGPPNAGKSSLLNALARREAAIVSEEAGTTRDVIEVRLDLDGLPVIVSDTAGIREPQGAIEREGIRRTLAHAGEADVVLWLSDAAAPPVRRLPTFRRVGTSFFCPRDQNRSSPVCGRRPRFVRVGQDRRGAAGAHRPRGGAGARADRGLILARHHPRALPPAVEHVHERA